MLRLAWCTLYLLCTLVPTSFATTLINANLQILKESDKQINAQMKTARTPLKEEYDFIIVGAGTAGCTLARRLSEVSEWSVLLLEAGGFEELFMDIPVYVGSLQKTEADWQYKTEPSTKYCLGYDKNQCSVPRGKVLGGSSVLNYMIATRGHKKDYDGWAALGNEGWSYQDVLPYFIKAENITIPSLRGDPWHGTSGPLTIGHLSYHSTLAKAFLKAGEELGHIVGDYNGANQNVFSYFQFTQQDGRRASNSRRYLLPVLGRPNLDVRVHSHVRRVMIEEGVARGVELHDGEGIRTIRARKEVVVAAGAINSPQLLMLSGLGPADHLAQLGIPLIKNLSVGYNFNDHVSFGGLIFTTNFSSQDLQPSCVSNDPKYLVEYVSKGSGPWQVPGGNEAVYFYSTEDSNNPDSQPELEIHFSTTSPFPEEKARGYRQSVFEKVFKPLHSKVTFAIQPLLMRPKSIGRLKLRSKDIADKPVLMPNYFAEEDDVQMLLKGVHKVMAISQTTALRKYGASIHRIPIPGCEAHLFGSDSYWVCTMRHLTFTNYHQSGTCKMGPATDLTAVVDNHLRVHGIQGLRVVDASIMPYVVSAHTNVPVNMIAERGADFVKQDNGK